MGFQGKFRDLSLVDILQVVQMTQKSGVLEIREGPRHASIVFRDGNIVDARPQGVGPLTDDLVARGIIPASAKEGLDATGVRVGERLVELGYVTPARLQEVLVQRVETTVYETLSWVSGSFDFDIAEAHAPGPPILALADVLPGVNFDTQAVLMEALRVFDEVRAGRAVVPERAQQPVAAPRLPLSPRLVLCGASGFAEQVRIAFQGMKVETIEAPTFDAALAAVNTDTRRPAVVVLHLPEARATLADEVGQLLLAAARIAVITVGPDPALAAAAIEAGAWAHVPILLNDLGPSLSFLQSLTASRLEAIAVGSPARAHASAASSGFGAGPLRNFSMQITQLRDRLDALAGEAQVSSVTLRVLEFVAERLDRAVLFLVRPGDLQGLGAFGHTAAGDPIGPVASGLRLPLEEDSVFTRAIEKRETVLCELPPGLAERTLYEAIGAPSPREALLLPLTSLGNAVALIYADNGSTGTAITDHTELEVMTRQAGLVLENALLRRLLEKRDRVTGRAPTEET